ncbi:MAG: hypothetical protein AB7S74_09530 [Hyphomicrobium sp.]|jgi:hypothetical protein|nr:hypothetical protein [Hyphomicrobium methylovorum]MBR2536494.1 hypothetical protein [Hyphomicrobium sp.]
MSNNNLTDQQIKDAGTKGNPVSTNGMSTEERNRVNKIWNDAKNDAGKK